MQQKITEATGEMPVPIVTDNNESRAPGLPTKQQVNERSLGENIRLQLTYKLASAGLGRPMQTGMRTNKDGHVYMTE